MSALLEHEVFCLPQPGEPEPRIERYTQTRHTQDGTTVAARVLTIRCIECAATSYTEV